MEKSSLDALVEELAAGSKTDEAINKNKKLSYR